MGLAIRAPLSKLPGGGSGKGKRAPRRRLSVRAPFRQN